MAEKRTRTDAATHDVPPREGEDGIRRWRVSELMGEAREAIVEHAGQDYRLRITAQNKLILTK